MLPNRVRRNYSGGAILNSKRGQPSIDGNMPEEWLCSTVKASNPGLVPIENEGLSKVEIKKEKRILRSFLEFSPEYYLGSRSYQDISFLAKWLDSSIRLHTQVHPTREFAKKYLDCPHGKFEAYYVLSIRKEISNPYIRLGFQRKDISKEIWKEIIENQDIREMDSCFEKIPVKQGDIIYIPGGVPHAIGEGIFLLEIMEPSDLVVRCEFEREGIIVPPEARFMGKSLDFCLDIFDYSYISKEDVMNNFFLRPNIIKQTDNIIIEKLVPRDISRCFDALRLSFYDESCIDLDDEYSILLCTKGTGYINAENISYEINELDSFFIASHTKEINIIPKQGKLEMCLIST